jgi:hypothetical protein
MQKIKIFLASSNELKEDRNQFEILIRRKNDEWIAEGKPYLELQIWEEASDAMSATRSQDEYNKIIQEVDIFVMLFWIKVGKYTHEEFTLAKKLFQETGKPRVLVYQKMANPENQEQSLKDFINVLLTQDKEYFWGNYEHFDTLQLKFEKELNHYYRKYFSPKTPTEMLATTLFAGLLSTYQSGALDFLKDIGLETAKDVAKETLKSLGEKVVGYFKGKKEGEKELKVLKLATNEQNIDDFKEQSVTVLELLKTTVENDAGFRKEVESILNGLDSEKQTALENAAGKMVSNVSNITGNNNQVFQGINNSTTHIGDNVGRDKIGKQVNHYKNSKDDEGK